MRALFAALVSLAALTTAAQADTPSLPSNDCFFSSSWTGWSAPGNGDALLLKINLHDIYRVDLVPGSHVRRLGDRFIVNHVRGSNTICSPLDLDLALVDHHGFHKPLIAQSLHKLSAEEIAAIPEHDRP